jgi:hypothetical protein
VTQALPTQIWTDQGWQPRDVTGSGPPPSLDRVRLSVIDPISFSSGMVPFPFGLLAAGQAIRDVGIVITQAFDDPGATISVGTIANPNLIVATTDNIPQILSEYRVSETHVAMVAEPLFVFVTPFASTQGRLRVYFSFQQF